MSAWEYLWLIERNELVANALGPAEEIGHILPAVRGRPLYEALSELGKEGWEACFAFCIGDGEMSIYCKRPLKTEVLVTATS